MNLFLLKNNFVYPTPEALLIPEFGALWERDYTGQKKTNAVEDLAYVYFMTYYQSPYKAYPPEDRKKLLKQDVIKRQRWREDEVVQAAIKRYDELQQTPSLRFLLIAESTLEKIMSSLEDAKLDTSKQITEVIKSIGDTKKLLLDIQDLTDRVRKERNVDTSIRGGGTIGPYEK